MGEAVAQPFTSTFHFRFNPASGSLTLYTENLWAPNFLYRTRVTIVVPFNGFLWDIYCCSRIVICSLVKLNLCHFVSHSQVNYDNALYLGSTLLIGCFQRSKLSFGLVFFMEKFHYMHTHSKQTLINETPTIFFIFCSCSRSISFKCYEYILTMNQRFCSSVVHLAI